VLKCAVTASKKARRLMIGKWLSFVFVKGQSLGVLTFVFYQTRERRKGIDTLSVI